MPRSYERSHDDLVVFSGTEALVLDLATGRTRFVLGHSAPVKSAAYSLDGKLLVTTSLDDQFTECVAQVWDAANGSAVGQPIKHKDGVLNASFSPDCREVVSASEDFTALISDIYGTKQPKRLGHTHQLRTACFNPSGSCVLTLTRDQFARVWDARSGEPLTPPLPHFAPIWHGRFVDESTATISDQKANCWIWKLRPIQYSPQDLTTLARIVNGDMTDANRSPGASYQELLERWECLKGRFPTDFTVSDRQRTAWHKQQVQAAENEGDSAALSFHLEQLRHCAPPR